MAKQGLAEIDPRGKRVLIRVDFNVPQDEAGRITDDRRIEAALPTIRYLLERDAKVILVSHLGRPKGVDPKWTLKPVADQLSDVLGAALTDPRRPFVAILGGKKVSDKIGVIENLMGRVDALLVGGGMAYTFLKAKGYEIGQSLLDADGIDLARRVMERAQKSGP